MRFLSRDPRLQAGDAGDPDYSAGSSGSVKGRQVRSSMALCWCWLTVGLTRAKGAEVCLASQGKTAPTRVSLWDHGSSSLFCSWLVSGTVIVK